MRLPFPTHIPIPYAYAFGLLLWLVQAIEGTSMIFGLLGFLFVLLSAVAFNLCDGFSRPSGAFIFFFSTLTALVGFVTKAFVGEAADSRLQLPILTISLYVTGIAMMLCAAYFSRRLRLRAPVLKPISGAADLERAAVGCLVVGALLPFVSYAILSGPETLLTPLARASNQLNPFLSLAIILAVTSTIRGSNGARSLSVVTLLASSIMIFQGGVLSYSKQALFTPFVCWLATAATLRYRVGLRGAVMGLVAAAAVVTYLVPYAQYGRNFRDPDANFSQQFATSMQLLSRLPEVRAIYKDSEEAEYSGDKAYFARPLGLLDRLEMISMDAALIRATQDEGELGIQPVVLYALNAVPHVIWKNKPEKNYSNQYGHEIGALAPNDESTNISFSPVGEGYRLLRWKGIVFLLPVLIFLLFVVVDSLCGDLGYSPWGILALISFAHIAPEGGIANILYFLSYGLVTLVFGFFVATYLTPLVGQLFTPPKPVRRNV